MIIKYIQLLLLLILGLQLPAKCMSYTLAEVKKQKIYIKALKVIRKDLIKAGFDLEGLAAYLKLSIQGTVTTLGINESNLSNPTRISLTPIQFETAAKIRFNILLLHWEKSAEKLKNTQQI